MPKVIGVSLSQIVCDVAGPIQVSGRIVGSTEDPTSRRDILNFPNPITVNSGQPVDVNSPRVSFTIGDPGEDGFDFPQHLTIEGETNIGLFPAFTVDVRTPIGLCRPLVDGDPPPTPFPVQVNGEATLVLMLCVFSGF